ncbi:MAG: hypothetical protein K5657_01435 [Desulfovibrio sp.]|nr:hypothetical protein [Desulfovibrio sp.]
MELVQEVAAHNVANVSTESFVPDKVHLSSAEPLAGVRVSGILKEAPPAGPTEDSGAINAAKQEHVPSGTNLGQEFTTMISNERSFEANTKTLQTASDMIGSLFDTVT